MFVVRCKTKFYLDLINSGGLSRRRNDAGKKTSKEPGWLLST